MTIYEFTGEPLGLIAEVQFKAAQYAPKKQLLLFIRSRWDIHELVGLEFDTDGRELLDFHDIIRAGDTFEIIGRYPYPSRLLMKLQDVIDYDEVPY